VPGRHRPPHDQQRQTGDRHGRQRQHGLGAGDHVRDNSGHVEHPQQCGDQRPEHQAVLHHRRIFCSIDARWEQSVPVLDEEYTTCVRELLPRLRRLGYLLSGDWHRADDLAQTTIERLYDKWRRVRAADNSSAV
jgi:hypothetical protein